MRIGAAALPQLEFGGVPNTSVHPERRSQLPQNDAHCSEESQHKLEPIGYELPGTVHRGYNKHKRSALPGCRVRVMPGPPPKKNAQTRLVLEVHN